jgi:hypothetical protein
MGFAHVIVNAPFGYLIDHNSSDPSSAAQANMVSELFLERQ